MTVETAEATNEKRASRSRVRKRPCASSIRAQAEHGRSHGPSLQKELERLARVARLMYEETGGAEPKTHPLYAELKAQRDKTYDLEEKAGRANPASVTIGVSFAFVRNARQWCFSPTLAVATSIADPRSQLVPHFMMRHQARASDRHGHVIIAALWHFRKDHKIGERLRRRGRWWPEKPLTITEKWLCEHFKIPRGVLRGIIRRYGLEAVSS